MSTLYRLTHSRSRHGCTQCKAKRLKCDQRKPGCRRCEESGNQCPGYVFNLRWSAKNQLHQNSAGSSRGQKPSVTKGDQACLQPGAASGDQGLAGTSGPSSLSLLSLFPNFGDNSYLPSPTQPGASQYPSLGYELSDSQWGFQGYSPMEYPLALGEPLILDSGFADMPTGHAISEDWPDAETQQYAHSTSSSSRTSNQHINQDSGQMIQRFSTMPRELSNLPTALSDFFIKEVISLFCAWDSQSNFMRVVVEKAWQSSRVLYHTMQSMAAACLTSGFPELSATAAQERLLALQCLEEDLSSSSDHPEVELLSTVLLCHSATWHNPGNMSEERFQATRKLVRDRVATATGEDSKYVARFFQTSLDYWGMLLSFFTDMSTTDNPFIGPEEPANEPTLHPFAGISGQTVKMLADIGRLVYQYRRRVSAIKFVTEADLDFLKSQIREARILEKRLLPYRPLDTSRLQDMGDPRTTLAHLAKIDEAYQYVGLLQIYRVFPDLLAERYRPWDKEQILSPRPPSKIPSKAEMDSWMTSLALHTLDLVREIPFESRSRSIQPLIFVAISNELRRGPQDVASLGAVDDQARGLGQSIIEVARARSFIRSRLSAYAAVLPLRKVANVLELVTSIWSALDEGQSDVYWLDICTQKELSTLMG
ncbi:hypothetical protein NW759_013530 [Fusarium solani]|nr:hypothetical protein NW759_013530 [Fusarium solani]